MCEILQYTTACLNSTIKYQACVLIARTDDKEGIPHVVIGLPLSERASERNMSPLHTVDWEIFGVKIFCR